MILEEDSNTTASIQFDALADLNEAIAELDDEDIIEDKPTPSAIESSLPTVSVTTAAIDLDEQPMESMDIDDDEEAISAEQEDDLYESLFNEIRSHRRRLRSEPDALIALKELVENRNYQI